MRWAAIMNSAAPAITNPVDMKVSARVDHPLAVADASIASPPSPWRTGPHWNQKKVQGPSPEKSGFQRSHWS
jgi:hypothetical protein